jgi:creatinine amidohydrolase
MKIFSVVLFFFTAIFASAKSNSVYIEDLTWPEVRDAIAGGKTAAIYYAGSTEQNGPHMALGKHNFIAHYVAGKLADRLGNALVYPTMPFAPTGDAIKKTEHMRFPGSVTIPDELFGRVAHDVALSAIASGFRFVFLLGDHGGGQEALAKTAEQLDDEFGPKGIHVYYIDGAAHEEPLRVFLKGHNLPPESHGGIDETSELMYIQTDHDWIREEKFAPADPAVGVEGDPRPSSAKLGKIFLGMKIEIELQQIRLRLRGVLPLVPILRKTYQQKGIDGVIAQYKELKQAHDQKYDFGDSQLERLGYEFYDQKQFPAALELFQLNAENFPDSWFVYADLGEVYFAMGDHENAKQNYQKSLEFNPDDTNAIEKLKQLAASKQ